MRRIIIFTIFTLITFFSFSQIEDILTDYIITSKNDTIFGKVYRTRSTLSIKFVNESGKKQSFRANTISGYKKGIKEYKVKRVNDMSVFVSVLISGPATLFELHDHMTEANGVYLIKKGDNFENISRRLLFNNQLSRLFKDYSALSIAIKNGAFKYTNTAEIVSLYNLWTVNKNSDFKIPKVRANDSRQNNHSKIEGKKIKLFTKIRLNSYGTYGGSTNSIVVYVQRPNEEKAIKITNKNLAETFKDHELLHEKITSEYYDMQDIETIVKIYNLTN